MKKLINIRVPLFLAVTFILGIYSCYEWYFGNFYCGLVVAVLLVALIVFCAIRRNGAQKIVIAMLIFSILGFGVARLSLYRMDKRESVGESVTISGRVCDLNRNASQNSVYYLEECTLSDGRKIHGRVEVTIYGTQLNTGDVVTVSGQSFSTHPVKSDVETSLIRDNITYKLDNATVIDLQPGPTKLDEKIRAYIYEATQEYMLQNSGVMYALLTGDRGAISDDVYYAFSRAGILHLLAVSGLHVGFIVAIICLALKRLCLHPLIEGALVLIPSFFYAYICAFTPSVMRAVVMVACSYIARACYGRYDMLSAISWSALLILLVRPFYLFDVGFQLSFLSVYGIATVYAPINRWISRRKLNKAVRYIVNSLLLSLSCVVATVFTVALNFGQVPLFSALLNIIAIPLVSVAFSLGIFGLIPSVFHYLLLVADYVLRVVVACAKAVAQLDFATIAVYAVAACTVILVAVLFVFGGFVNFGKLGKRIFYPMCAILLVVSILFAVIPTHARSQAYVAVTDDSDVVAAVSDSGEGALILDFNDYSALYNATHFLQHFRLTSCTLYVTDSSEATPAALDLLESLPLNKVYVLDADTDGILRENFEQRGVSVINQYPNSTTGDSIKVQSYFDAVLFGVSVTVDEIDICIAYGGADSVRKLMESGISAGVYVLSDTDAVSPSGVLTITPYQSAAGYNYGANKYGNFTIVQKGDRIYLSFR
ncbi:MAG: ComEC/Rec2 family competence protein [Clostridiales bacterium]|nr:ComEC/Rec2 family competence protein [Clostridiales bacterium]